jgi:TET-Associated Glycosyltransferase
MNPRFPLYIVSKGRAETRLTSKALDAMRVPYHLVIESQEFDLYASFVDESKLLVLDPQYQRDYDTCDDLGDSKSKGPGAARNFAWAHAMSLGAPWHWGMDDNIRGFYRLYRNDKIDATDGTIFRCMEDFCLRYANVAMAGPAYDFMTKRKFKLHPIIFNTRIYSCNLIRNDVPFRWRGRYNEDTDLSLRMLKAGWCTFEFNAFLQRKAATQTIKGGCDKDFYAKEGTAPKSEMQVRLHPDCSRLVFKFGRIHHSVDYRRFAANKLVLRDDVVVPTGVNEYGMQLTKKAATR